MSRTEIANTASTAIAEIAGRLAALNVDFQYLQELQEARSREGTLIQGTGRNQDLIPAYLAALQDIDEGLFEALNRPMPPDDDAPWWVSEYAMEYRTELEEALCATDEILFFGAHPGDGSDMGFWMDEMVAEELTQLEAQAGDATTRDDVLQELEAIAVYVQFRSGWYREGASSGPAEIRIQLNTQPRLYVQGNGDGATIGGYKSGEFHLIDLTYEEEKVLLEFVRHVWGGEAL